MSKLEMLLIWIAAFSMAIHHSASFAESQEAPKRDRPMNKPYVVTMSYGAYSSRMSSDRKTVIQNPDGRVVAEEIHSPNKKYYAFADLRTNTTTVYEVIREGNFGRRAPLWNMDGCLEMVGLSNDGRRLVIGYEGMNTIPIEYSEDLPMISFFTAGEPTGRVGLGQLIADLSKLERTESGYYWGRYLGLNAAGDFAVETVEGETILFDLEDAERVTYEHAEAADIPDWKVYRDVLRCYEYSYPDSCAFKESLTHNGRPAGRTSLKKRDGKSPITAEIEEPATYGRGMYDTAEISFEDFAVERAKLRCSADGPNSSWYAGDVVKKEMFENPYGRTCVEFYLSVIHESYDEEGEETTVEKTIRGPYYAVSISQQSEPYRVLLFKFSNDGEGEIPRDGGLMRRIVDTVRILR